MCIPCLTQTTSRPGVKGFYQAFPKFYEIMLLELISDLGWGELEEGKRRYLFSVNIKTIKDQ